MQIHSADQTVLSFEPRYALDLDTGTAKDFHQIVGEMSEWIRREPPTAPLPFAASGWYTITPEVAQELLRHNTPGFNRKAEFATIVYYAQQMLENDWKPTGQGLLFDTKGHLIDGQHRLYACLFSGVPFQTFVVIDVPEEPGLFAYVDNSRPRNAAAALQTAGYNGVSPLIAAIIKIDRSIKGGLYTVNAAGHLPKISPATMLKLMDQYPNVQAAARSAASDWTDAVRLLAPSGKGKDVVGYIGMRIMDLYGEEVAEEFFEDLVNNPHPEQSEYAITAFQKVIEKDRQKPDPMRKHQLLGTLIKTFNAWKAGEPLRKRWMLQINDNFPSLDEPVSTDVEAA